jgi:hypothetical protein
LGRRARPLLGSGPAAGARLLTPTPTLITSERLEFIRSSGATAVLLSGVQLRGPHGEGGGPLSFFSPDPQLGGGSSLEASRQLKQLVDGLHSAGLEVLLQVGAQRWGWGRGGGAGAACGDRIRAAARSGRCCRSTLRSCPAPQLLVPRKWPMVPCCGSPESWPASQ